MRSKLMHAGRARRSILVAVVALAGFILPATSRADTITQWNQIASNELVSVAGQGAVANVHLAMMHGAMYDAVNAIDRRYEPYLYAQRARRWYSQDAAAATAAYRVLLDSSPPLVPAAQQPALVARVQPLYDAALAAIPDSPAKTGGIATGNAAAEAMIAARTGDGRFGAFRFTIAYGPGQWRPEPPDLRNDPGAWLKDVRPFLIDDGSQFASGPPNPLTSRRYTREFDEVKSLGSLTSTTRTPDQTDAGRFWGQANGVGTWSALLRAVADAHPAAIADQARLFAKAYLASADALITVWNDKARYSFWRPINAIRHADEDGNPATSADPDWTPLVTTPPYPDHSSGLSAAGSAAVSTLRNFYRTDDVTFSTTNVPTPPTAPIERTFTSFSQAADEIVNARVWAGIHFRTADTAGARIGRRVVRYAEHEYFGRVHRGDHDHYDQGDDDGQP
jgi:hypothetical protein